MSGTKSLNSSDSLGELPAPPMKSMRPAGFWRRCLANAIDSAIVFLMGSLFELTIRYVFPIILTRSPWVLEGLSWGASLAIAFLYYGYTLSRMGTSPGKAVLSMRVLDDTNGTHLSFLRGGLRCALGYWISVIPLFFGYLMIVFRSDKKALHDLMFGSHVWYIEK